jgi:thymidylate kinase
VSCIKKTARHHKWNYFTYVLGKALHRKGIIMAFQGTDGSGKSTIIEGIPAVIGNSFSGDTIEYYHWRPGFIHPEKKFTSDGQLLSNVQPHTKKPQGKIKSIAKMAFYTLDYILGYYGRVYWQAAKGHLVIFDRYYYDFYMDKIRYRLSISDGWVRFFQIFIPKPDITFLLLGDAVQIHERKQELSIEEINKQTKRLIQYRKLFSNPTSVNVNHTIPEVLNKVCSDILHLLHKRNQA